MSNTAGSELATQPTRPLGPPELRARKVLPESAHDLGAALSSLRRGPEFMKVFAAEHHDIAALGLLHLGIGRGRPRKSRLSRSAL